MKNKRLMNCCFLLAIGIIACEPQAGSARKGIRIDITWKSNIDGDAAFFLKDAALLAKEQLEYANLALSTSNDPQIKKSAQELMQKNKNMLVEMDRIATEGELLLPGHLPFDIKEKLERLKALTGQEFDREYVQQVTRNKEKMSGLFASGADVITKAVGAFAARTSF